MEKSEFSKRYNRLSGLTIDLDAVIAKTAEEDLGKLYSKIRWQLKSGLVRTIGSVKDDLSAFLQELAVRCNVDTETFDLDSNGEISKHEEKLKDEYSSVVIIEDGSED